MELTDTHCHLQFKDYPSPYKVLAAAAQNKVTRLICVGTDIADSHKAIDMAAKYKNVWASVGVHPHEAASYAHDKHAEVQLKKLLDHSQVVAVGEIGLDLYKSYSSRADQEKALRLQIETAGTKLPFIFHVRDAWGEFWSVFDSYKSLRGVVHSFSAHPGQLDQILTRGLYVGLNGIMTFTDDKLQLSAAEMVPKNKLVLETDAPFLTPAPDRGQLCEPKHIRHIAQFLADLRGESVEELASYTTKNARELFGI